MDFEFTPEQLDFIKEVEEFLDANDDPEIFDVTRENMAQIVDTPLRRQFMAKVGEQGWLGITWPKEYGGKDGEGIYEYLLNEALAARGGPQIGKGVGIIGKTIISHGSEELKREFLPKILRNEVEFAVGYSEPNAGSDAASMQLKATKVDGGWNLNGQKTWTTSAHFADWYWVGARTDPEAPKHHGITLFLVPMNHPNITVKGIWTMGDERTNEVYLDDVFVPDEYVVGELNKGFQYISEALDLERFTLFTYSPIAQRLEVLTEYVKAATPRRRTPEGRRGDPVTRSPSCTRRPRWPGCSDSSSCSPPRRAAPRPPRRPPSTSCSPPSTPAGWPTPRWTSVAPGPSSGCGARTPHARPLRVDLPVHGDRHHRWRRLGDPEEHHRPPQTGPAQELLIRTCSRDRSTHRRCRRAVARPRGLRRTRWAVDRGHCPGPASVGPAARCTRILADYGATVVKVGAVAGRGAEPIRPPVLRLQRVPIPAAHRHRSEGPRRTGRLPGPGGVGRRGGGELPTRGGGPAGNRLRPTCRRSTAGSSCARPPDTASTGPTPPGPATTSTTWRWGATWPPPSPGPTVALPCRGRPSPMPPAAGMQAALAVMAALIGRGDDGPGTHLDVSIADGVLWMTSLAVDEHLATGASVGPGQNIITGRYACYDTYRAADGGWLAVGAIEAKFFANLCRLLGCAQWIDHQLDDDAQDGIRADFRAAFATRDRDDWAAELAGADTCVTPVLSGRGAGR